MKILSLYKGVLLAFASILLLTDPTVVFGVNCDKNPNHRNCLVDPPPPDDDAGTISSISTLMAIFSISVIVIIRKRHKQS